MTHSGGKPHAIGDRGQRYEVRATGWPKAEQSVIGWWSDLQAAHQAAAGFKKAPGCTEVEIFDREKGQAIDVNPDGHR